MLSVPIDNRQKHLDVMCFPVLFPTGKYGEFHPRQEKLSHSEYSGGSRISERGGQSTPLGGSGGMLPQKIYNFRPSEVVSGAFWVENCFLRLL